jgi:hypothetical protein
MDGQLLIVGVLVILALVYLSRQTLRAWIGRGSGCGGCKCPGTAKTPNSNAETLIPVEQLTLRRR